MTWKYLSEFGNRSALLPHPMTYAFSLRIEYKVEGDVGEGQRIALVASRPADPKTKSSHHVLGNTTVVTTFGLAVAVPQMNLVRGASDVLTDDRYSVPFEGHLLFGTDESELLAIRHRGKLSMRGGSETIAKVGSTGKIFVVLQTETASLRFRWMAVNQLAAVGNVEVLKGNILAVDMDCLIAA